MDRILVVEDDPTTSLLLKTFLSKAGYAVDQATDGVEAWEKLVTSPAYALVVTDRNMPKMGGIELFEKMKASEILKHTPVIMQTAANTPEEVVEGIQAGVYYYLSKPFEGKTILTLAQSAIREMRQKARVNGRLTMHNEALGTFVRGEFQVRTLEEGNNVAFMLGSLFPRPDAAIAGLDELILNAIEHGNLGLGYIEKGRLLQAGQWEQEIIRRLAAPENIKKKVVVQFQQDAALIEVTIHDEGHGFDWRPYMEIEPSRATQSNGRGIAKANLLAFEDVRYKGKGNQVHVSSSVKKAV